MFWKNISDTLELNFSFSYLQEFMLCRNELNDPRKCISEGKAVTNCALDFFRKIKKTCSKEFAQYANCLDKSSTKYEFEW
jgi:NADH dehydrogenase (ubiquinone) 1 alpha subcomplex subunit 8